MKHNLPRIDENAFYAAATQRHNNNQLQEAKDLYRAILTQNPRHAGAIFGMGTMAMQVGQFEKAEEFIRKAIKIGPATASMYINLGAVQRNLEKYDKAIRSYDRAIKIDKKNAAAFYNKGRTHQELKEYEKARSCYERAVSLSSHDADAWVNLGTTQMEMDEPDLALYSFETAARLDSKIGAPYSNAAAVLFDRGLHETAMVLINKALELEPENTEFRHRLSSFLLTCGRLEKGWVDFDLRFTEVEKCWQYRRPEPPPYWDGESLQDKKILVWTEQGFGEEILAAAVIPDLIETGVECVLACSPRMMPVCQKAFPNIAVSTWGQHEALVTEADPPFDFQFPALSLLKTFRPTLESIVEQPPIIEPDKNLVKKFRDKYERLANGRPIVGLSWRSKNDKFGDVKSIPLSAFEPILCTEDIFFVNLQYGDCAKEIADVKNGLGVDIFIDEEVDAYGDLAPVLAQIAAIDLVVSVSNSNVHFAGAMGIPTWMMVPKGRGHLWFWFMDREDSPWYPSVRLFRQKSGPTDDEPCWPEVVEDVAAALQSWLAEVPS